MSPRSETSLIVLTRWLDGLSYQQVRGVESLQPAKLANGRHLRGVELAVGLILARDRRLYRVLDGVAHVVPLHLVAEQFDPHRLMTAFRSAKRTARARRRAARRGRFAA